MTGEVFELCCVNLSNHPAARGENQHWAQLCRACVKRSGNGVGLYSLPESFSCLAEKALEAVCTHCFFISRRVQIFGRSCVGWFCRVPDVYHHLTGLVIGRKWLDARFIRPMDSNLPYSEGTCCGGKGR